MASPQPDKYTKISNELLEALYQTKFNSSQWKIILYSIRSSYGYHKKEFSIRSLRRLAVDLKSDSRSISGAFNLLITKHVLIHVNGNIYRLNKDYEKWESPLPGVTTPKSGSPHSQKWESPLPPSYYKEKRKKETPIAPRGGESFDLFWGSYPKKIGKGAAEKAWEKMSPPLQEVLKAVESQKYSREWKKEDGEFIPNPATWLNQKRWEDELNDSRTGTTSRIDKLFPRTHGKIRSKNEVGGLPVL